MNTNQKNGLSDSQCYLDLTESQTIGHLSPQSNPKLGFNFHHLLLDLSDFSDKNQPQTVNDSEVSFSACLEAVEKILASWGLEIGEIMECRQNKKTLLCLLALIGQRQRDLKTQQKFEEQITGLEKQRRKYKNLLSQAKYNNDRKNKKLGVLESSFEDFQTKLKEVQKQTKQREEQDRRTMIMLRSRNQQIIHELKKKDLELSKIREYCNKNMNDKNVQRSLSFQVHEAPVSNDKKAPDDQIKQMRISKLTTEKQYFEKQNQIFRNNLQQIKSQISQFADWVDFTFRSKKERTFSKFLNCNHNFIFKKQSISEQFGEILQQIKCSMLIGKDNVDWGSLSVQRDKKYLSESNLPSNNFPKSKQELEQKQKRGSINEVENKVNPEAEKEKDSLSEEEVENIFIDHEEKDMKNCVFAVIPSSETSYKCNKQKIPMIQSTKIDLVSEKSEEDSEMSSKLESEVTIISHISFTQASKQKFRFVKRDKMFNDEVFDDWI